MTTHLGHTQSRIGGQLLRLLIASGECGSRDLALCASRQPTSFASNGSMRPMLKKPPCNVQLLLLQYKLTFAIVNMT